MIGVTTSRPSARLRSRRRRWIPSLAGLGMVALAATACGGAGATATPSVASSSSASARSQAAFPGVVGTAAAVSGSSIEVQNPTSGQVTVTFTASTAITDTVSAKSADLTVGSCVTVVGQPSAGGAATRTVTATTVTISTPVNGNCTSGFGGAGFGGGGLGGPGGSFSPNPSFSPRPRPSGTRGPFGNGGFGGANGKVTSLSAGGFVVQGRSPAAGNSAAGTSTSVTVTTTATTTYLKAEAVHSSALKVGQCITAVGSTNSIGAVAARTIRISQPGPNGCVTSFGRRGGFGGGSGGVPSNG